MRLLRELHLSKMFCDRWSETCKLSWLAAALFTSVFKKDSKQHQLGVSDLCDCFDASVLCLETAFSGVVG